MTATFKEYMEQKTAFAQKHNKKGECKVWRHPMINNRSHEEMSWTDGHEWCEVTELITEEVEIEVHGIKTTVSVDLWRTEFWSTEHKSKYMYERS